MQRRWRTGGGQEEHLDLSPSRTGGGARRTAEVAEPKPPCGGDNEGLARSQVTSRLAVIHVGSRPTPNPHPSERGQSALVGGGVELRPPASVVGSRAGGWMGMGAARAAGGDGCRVRHGARGVPVGASPRLAWRPSAVARRGRGLGGILDPGGRGVRVRTE